MNQTLIVQLVSGDQTLLRFEYQTDVSHEVLLERIPQLLEKTVPESTADISSDVSPKYESLARLFLRQRKDDVRLSFSQIEKELSRKLPDSARSQRAWWANTLSHSQATAWMLTGWKMIQVDLETETVKFERTVLSS